MERLTRELIEEIPRDVKDITLTVCDVLPMCEGGVGKPRKSAPGIKYNGMRGPADYISGQIICEGEVFNPDSYIEARIVASEARVYFESFGAKVTIEDKNE